MTGPTPHAHARCCLSYPLASLGHGLAQLALLSSEGFAPDLQDRLATLALTDPDAYRAVFDALLRTAAEPSILGMSHHLLYVGQKTADR